ncbi:MAG: HupE/UreJ family protein [Alphaproteobacteria bacterium]
MPRLLPAVLLLTLLTPTPASPHALHPALLDLAELPDNAIAVTWKTSLTQLSGVSLSPRLPTRCTDVGDRAESVDGIAVVERWTVRCGPGGLAGLEVAVDGLAASKTDALVRAAFADGRTMQAVLRPASPAMVVPSRPSRLSVLRDYARMGVEHILGGPDHLLFVLGLLLLATSPRMLLGTITAFTVGHSITLALAALGLARLRQQPVDVAIAATVFVLAVEVAGGGRGTAGRLRRSPWLVAGLFGLLHGLGFAGALAEVGLPQGEVPLSVLSFNLGIEAGQLLFVAAVIALDVALRRRAGGRPAWVQTAVAYAMGSLAALWCIERTAALFGV